MTLITLDKMTDSDLRERSPLHTHALPYRGGKKTKNKKTKKNKTKQKTYFQFLLQTQRNSFHIFTWVKMKLFCWLVQLREDVRWCEPTRGTESGQLIRHLFHLMRCVDASICFWFVTDEKLHASKKWKERLPRVSVSRLKTLLRTLLSHPHTLIFSSKSFLLRMETSPLRRTQCWLWPPSSARHLPPPAPPGSYRSPTKVIP